ncbi:MAG: hypothetical protein H6Q67_1160 [Firmicutes bacterium]|nr:hypothetical protein [Bacillota bacterium]
MVERLNPFSVCPACGSVARWDVYEQKNICKECELIRPVFRRQIEINHQGDTRRNISERAIND